MSVNESVELRDIERGHGSGREIERGHGSGPIYTYIDRTFLIRLGERCFLTLHIDPPDISLASPDPIGGICLHIYRDGERVGYLPNITKITDITNTQDRIIYHTPNNKEGPSS